jgi:hypothetical protein
MKAEDAAIRPVISLLSKGENGSGKTILSASPILRPTYVFDFENRFDSVLRYYKGNLKDLEFDSYPIGTSYYNIDKKMDDILARPIYKTVVAASLTSFIYNILNHLIMMKVAENKTDKRIKVNTVGGIPINQLQDFNAEDSAIINDLVSFFQQLKAQGTNCILEAHISPYEMRYFEGGQQVTETIRTILTKGKKAPAAVPGFFNEVWLFEKAFEGMGTDKSVKYKVNTVGSPLDACKTSWGIKNFDFSNHPDPYQLVLDQLSDEVKTTPAADPNRPQKVSF